MPGKDSNEAQMLYACLLSSRGKSVTEIAEALGHNRTTITRWLRRAADAGWIDRSPRLSLTPEELLKLSRRAHDEEKEYRLLRLLATGDSPLRRVHIPQIVPPIAEQARQDPSALADHLREVTGRAAAIYVNDLINQELPLTRLGISWGRSLRCMVQQVAAVPRKEIPGLTTLPLIGNLELLGETRNQFVSSEANTLASDLTRCYGGADIGPLTAPAFLPKPRGRSDEELAVLRRYFEATPLYAEIFGAEDRPGRIWDTEMVVIGIGAVDTSAWPRLTQHIDEQDLAELREAGAVGDIGGRFFTGYGLHDPPGCDCMICRTNSRVLGVNLRTLSALAHGGGPQGAPLPEGSRDRRVVAVASGRQKARAIAAASRMAVTDLITDEDTAQAMLDILDPAHG